MAFYQKETFKNFARHVVLTSFLFIVAWTIMTTWFFLNIVDWFLNDVVQFGLNGVVIMLGMLDSIYSKSEKQKTKGIVFALLGIMLLIKPMITNYI